MKFKQRIRLFREYAATGDVVTGKQPQDRARYHDGSDKIGNSDNKPGPEHDQPVKKGESLSRYNRDADPVKTDRLSPLNCGMGDCFFSGSIPGGHRAEGSL